MAHGLLLLPLVVAAARPRTATGATTTIRRTTCSSGEAEKKTTAAIFGLSETVELQDLSSRLAVEFLTNWAKDLGSGNSDKDVNNVVLAPFGVAIGLGMLYEGLDGQTKRNVGSELGFPVNDRILREQFKVQQKTFALSWHFEKLKHAENARTFFNSFRRMRPYLPDAGVKE